MLIYIARLYEDYATPRQALRDLEADGVVSADISIIASNVEAWYSGDGDIAGTDAIRSDQNRASGRGQVEVTGHPDAAAARASGPAPGKRMMLLIRVPTALKELSSARLWGKHRHRPGCACRVGNAGNPRPRPRCRRRMAGRSGDRRFGWRCGRRNHRRADESRRERARCSGLCRGHPPWRGGRQGSCSRD
jgi:hypothetical protein